MSDDTEMSIDNGMVGELSKKSGKIRIRDTISSLSQNIDTCDDQKSDCSSDSVIPPSENGGTPTRAKVRFFHS